MAYSAKVLADSISPAGKRLTTLEVSYPRFVHSEFMTHRALSRNSASSRAIPIAKMIERVNVDPVLPVWWGKNQSGMQAKEELENVERALAERAWLQARNEAVRSAGSLMSAGLHKQIANRLLEPWMWITVIVSATEWSNFFALRCHPDAQPEIRKIAEMMREEMEKSTPTPLSCGEWHLPMVSRVELDELLVQHEREEAIGIARKVAVGRCARVSYLTHDGKRDLQADVDLCDRLAQSGHWSPFEHVASAMENADERRGNFFGWRQYRKEFDNEHAGGTMP